MTLPRKGTRQLVLDGTPYRWTVAAGEEPGIAVIAELVDQPGSRLVSRLEYGVAISPGLVRSAILDALAAGWRAHQRGADFVRRVPELSSDRAASHQCPVCDYFSLQKRGEYEICPVCFWEDDGLDTDRLDAVSGPNHITLRQARESFRTVGACDPASVANVLPAVSRSRFRHAPR